MGSEMCIRDRSYTVETLRDLRAERPDDELFFLMGADSVFDLPNWRSPEEICELATLAVVDRPGQRAIDFDALSDITTPERIDYFRKHIVPMPQLEISSSEIRERVAQKKSIRFQTPRAVEQYIAEEGLYTT